MDIRTRQLVWRSTLIARRAARERRRKLWRELAAYRTPAERDELLAAAARCPEGRGDEVRRILLDQSWRAELTPTQLHLRGT